MLRVAARSAAVVLGRQAGRGGARAGACVRWMSDNSHDDFKPQVKVQLDDEDAVQGTIKQLVEDHPVFLFMKGTPQQPMCGFSQQAVRILHSHGVNFSSVNVLEHGEIREGVKAFSDWPTIPQLYVGGDFVGGCDIITTLHNEGELEGILAEAAPGAEARE